MGVASSPQPNPHVLNEKKSKSRADRLPRRIDGALSRVVGTRRKLSSRRSECHAVKQEESAFYREVKYFTARSNVAEKDLTVRSNRGPSARGWQHNKSGRNVRVALCANIGETNSTREAGGCSSYLFGTTQNRS